jgi:hypothetical protein
MKRSEEKSSMLDGQGIPFIGQNGFYPHWVSGADVIACRNGREKA